MKRDTGEYGLVIEYIRNPDFLSLVAKILSSSPSSSSTLNSLTIIYLTADFAVIQPIII